MNERECAIKAIKDMEESLEFNKKTLQREKDTISGMLNDIVRKEKALDDSKERYLGRAAIIETLKKEYNYEEYRAENPETEEDVPGPQPQTQGRLVF